jgi:acetyltransferase-like isoleucine patch superfamily enzyme
MKICTGIDNCMHILKNIIIYCWKVAWLKTIYFNLSYFPIQDAIRLPILVFNNTRLLRMKGKIVIEGNIKFGLVKLGHHNAGTLDMKYNRTIWQNDGTVFFLGSVNIGSGTRLSINKDASLTIGNNFCITGGSSIICSNNIYFGEGCLLSWDILIMDTDFHNVLNINQEIINFSKPIRIGDRVWIGCRSIILKGVNICNDIVIAAGSKITKDIKDPNCIIGGMDNPKIIKENIYWRK